MTTGSDGATYRSNHRSAQPEAFEEAMTMLENVRAPLERGMVWTIAAMIAMIAPAMAGNDYPTSETADYVLGCMAANGNTREALLKCSCSIDYIAKRLSFAQYEKAETAPSLQLGGGVGGRVALFRDPPEIKEAIEQLRQIQAEATLQCFG